MIRFRAALTALALLAAGTAIGARPAPTPAGISIRNAEDLAPLPGGRWVIASSMAGPSGSGALYAVDAATGRSVRLYPDSRDPREHETPACGRGVEPSAFAPHGLAFWPVSRGGGTLYVVNHGERESIEIFTILPGRTPASPPYIRWEDCTRAPKEQMQNSVAVTAGGTLYVTLTPDYRQGSDLEDHAENAVGAVWSWHPTRGWRPVPGSEMAGPNGIVATPDGRRLYVSSWPKREIVELTLGPDGTSRRTLDVDFLPDNLRWAGDGTILAAGHRGAVSDVVDCYMSAKGDCALPSTVAVIDPVAFRVRCARPVAASFATVAAPVGGEVWIGTARGSRITRIAATTVKGPRCG
ncbi:SMP-30/gluconolactonase/LRE family protein [Flavisphingomonas formosensis]|uniref:SMP-30/gluconolactonase/LRE family protein n=1 Tax=Flavisphingomonas formosensis TaxID=861534 RepID=UPI0012F897C8|nr:SMP-30/gluconolactonase/LRE family protein [Sphingomonas formosensis]